MAVNVDKIRKWQRWLEVIEKDISWAVSEAEVFHGFVRVHNENIEHIRVHHGARFCGSIQTWYAFFSGFAIRRHVDNSNSRDNRSLFNFLRQLCDSAEDVTYDSYLKAIPIDPHDRFPWQETIFARFSTDRRTLSAEIILKDIDRLDELRDKIAGQIDKLWAHIDRTGAKESESRKVTWKVLSEGLALLKEMAFRYLGLFNCSTGLLDIVHTYPWMTIFRVPLDITGPNANEELGR
jgi:hypothetical protein